MHPFKHEHSWPVGVSGPNKHTRVQTHVTWKVRRSLLGLSLMSSIGVALIITSVITAHATRSAARDTNANTNTHGYSQFMHIISRVSARTERTDRGAFEKDAEIILWLRCMQLYNKTNSKQSLASSALACFSPHARLHGNCFLSTTTYRKPFVKRPQAQLHSSPQWKPPKPAALLHLNTSWTPTHRFLSVNTDSLRAKRAGIQKSPRPTKATHSVPMQTEADRTVETSSDVVPAKGRIAGEIK